MATEQHRTEIRAINGTISVDRNDLGQISVHVIKDESSPVEAGLFGVQVWMTPQDATKLSDILRWAVWQAARMPRGFERKSENLKGDGEHEFRDIQDEDFDRECIYCGVRIISGCGIAGAMMPCHEEQRSLKRDDEDQA